MKTRKRRFELLSFYDHTGIEQHLTEMARRGWMIQRMSNYGWTYRRIEPQELSFTVSYFPKASAFDPAPSEAQQTLLDFCAQSGWKLVCSWFQMQVFCSSEPQPTPIHTEPALEVEAIHRACKANYLRSYLILFGISLVMTLLFLSSLISDTLRILASPTDFITGTGFLLLFLLCLIELTAYYTWHRRAKRAAQHGLFLDTPSTSGFQRILLIVLAACVLIWLGNILSLGSPLMGWIILMVSLTLAAVVSLTGAVRELLKKLRAPAGVNRGLTFLASLLLSCVLMTAVVSLGAALSSGLTVEELPLNAQAPLLLSDLGQSESGSSLTTVSPDESLLLARLEVFQRPGFEEDARPDAPTLRYERYTVKLPALYPFCRDQLKRLMVLSAFWDGEMEIRDAAPWGAEEVWRLVRDDSPEPASYLLCYENILVWIEFSWEPTPEQMAIVGSTLGK